MHLRETIKKKDPEAKLGIGCAALLAFAIAWVAVVGMEMLDVFPHPATARVVTNEEPAERSVPLGEYRSVSLAPGEWSRWMQKPVGASKSWHHGPRDAKVMYELELASGKVIERLGTQWSGYSLDSMRRMRFRNVSAKPLVLTLYCDCPDLKLAREVDAERDRLEVAAGTSGTTATTDTMAAAKARERELKRREGVFGGPAAVYRKWVGKKREDPPKEQEAPTEAKPAPPAEPTTTQT